MDSLCKQVLKCFVIRSFKPHLEVGKSCDHIMFVVLTQKRSDANKGTFTCITQHYTSKSRGFKHILVLSFIHLISAQNVKFEVQLNSCIFESISVVNSCFIVMQ